MRLHQFIFFVGSTVIIGAVVGVVATLTGWFLHVPWHVGLVSGAFLSTTSLMGFWAYLTLNFIARLTLPRRVWRWAQALIVAVVLYDMVWWRYHLDITHHPVGYTSLSTYLIQALWPLAAAVIGASLKRHLSGKGSFLPALFYLYVFTVVDWLLVINSQSGPVVNQTGIVMMACNLYMALIYGKLLVQREAAPPISARGGANIPTAGASQ